MVVFPLTWGYQRARHWALPVLADVEWLIQVPPRASPLFEVKVESLEARLPQLDVDYGLTLPLAYAPQNQLLKRSLLPLPQFYRRDPA